jgi:hypothetical protein
MVASYRREAGPRVASDPMGPCADRRLRRQDLRCCQTHRLQPAGAPVPSSARVLITVGDQRNVEFGYAGGSLAAEAGVVRRRDQWSIGRP